MATRTTSAMCSHGTARPARPRSSASRRPVLFVSADAAARTSPRLGVHQTKTAFQRPRPGPACEHEPLVKRNRRAATRATGAAGLEPATPGFGGLSEAVAPLSYALARCLARAQIT